jgi:hypothetical protein
VLSSIRHFMHLSHTKSRQHQCWYEDIVEPYTGLNLKRPSLNLRPNIIQGLLDLGISESSASIA